MFTTNDLRHFLEGLAILFAIGYWGTMLLLLWFLVRFAYKKPKQNAGKILSGSLTAAAILILFVWMIPKQFGPSKEEIQAQEEWDRKYKEAEAVFNEQCKTAGEKIYRTVDNVEGIMLLKVIPEDNVARDTQTRDPMWADAALHQGASGKDFIESFLKNGDKKYYYRYVDVLESINNKEVVTRYSGRKNHLQNEGIVKNPARYAVTYEVNVDPALRKHWVAGASIQIIDRERKEVIAEKTWFAFEKGLGGTGGARMPWLFAVACYSPDSPRVRLGIENNMSEYFVPKILTPKLETENVKH